MILVRIYSMYCNAAVALLILAGISVTASAQKNSTYVVVYKDILFHGDPGENKATNKTQKAVSSESIRQISERLIDEANMLHTHDPSPTTSREDAGESRLLNVYQKALQGFSAELTEEAAEYIERQAEVEYVVKDIGGGATSVQSPVRSWGVDRIDQRNLPLDSTYEYNFDGTAVHAYVFDSGIRATHIEFTGRVGNGYDAQDQDNTPSAPR